MVLMGNKLVAEYIGRIIDTRRPETIERTDLFRLDSYASSTSCDLEKMLGWIIISCVVFVCENCPFVMCTLEPRRKMNIEP